MTPTREKEMATMTMTVQKPHADLRAPGSMSIRELLLELATLEDDLAEAAGGSDGTHSPDAAALTGGASARERVIRDELRQRRLALRD